VFFLATFAFAGVVGRGIDGNSISVNKAAEGCIEQGNRMKKKRKGEQ